MTQVQSDPAAEQAVREVYDYAAGLMAAGQSNSQVRQQLMQQGLDAETAGIVVNNLSSARSSAVRGAGMKNMLFGALWCVGGTIVTVATYSAASDGGTYVVFWGAIIFGAIQFLRGLIQAMSGR